MLQQTSKLLQLAWKPVVSSVRHCPYPKKFYNMLKMNPEPCFSMMNNGLRVASVERPGKEYVCLGLFIDAGSRYESNFENGIAHFFEHIAFKGTRTRNASQIQCAMNCIGARFKCFTTREQVVYYVECLSEDITLVLDILTDCVFNNAYVYEEIERQKEVVYQEMLELEQDGNAVLWDYLHGAAFFGTPLGQTVMGPSSNLYNFCESTIRNYVEKVFDPTRTVLAAVGSVCHEQLVDLAQLYLLRLESNKCFDEFYRFTAGDFRFRDDAMHYCNAILAFEAPCLCDNRSYTMDVAAHIIGGWEKGQVGGILPANLIGRACSDGGFGPGYRSFYLKYKDTGLWGIQFLCNKVEVDALLYNIQKELMNMCTVITHNEVERGKNNAKAALMSKLETNTGMCLDVGKWALYNNGRWPPLHEQLHELEQVLVEDIHRECDQFLYDRCPVVAAVGAVEGLPAPQRIRGGQYWLRW